MQKKTSFLACSRGSLGAQGVPRGVPERRLGTGLNRVWHTLGRPGIPLAPWGLPMPTFHPLWGGSGPIFGGYFQLKTTLFGIKAHRGTVPSGPRRSSGPRGGSGAWEPKSSLVHRIFWPCFRERFLIAFWLHFGYIPHRFLKVFSTTFPHLFRNGAPHESVAKSS